MFDGSYKDLNDTSGLDAGRLTRPETLPRTSASADPVGFLHDLEGRLARSETVLQEQVSRLSRRLDALEEDVRKLNSGSPEDLLAIERELVMLADRLVKLES